MTKQYDPNMSAATTDWFPADVKPVHAGIYQCREGDQNKWHWDGRVWRSFEFGWECSLQKRSWRELTSDPKASKP